MHRISRTPHVGDMIIETCQKTYVRHIGVVYKINRDTWGHQRNVYIEWTDGIPMNYNVDHGYSGTNIHNLRDRYDIYRDGQRVDG